MVNIDLSKIEETLKELDDIYFLLLAIILAFGTLQTTGEILQTDKPVVTVVSPSMCPELQVGDILFVHGTEFDNINENDIIVYDVPDRADFSINGDSFRLEGENSKEETSIGTVRLIDVVPSESRSNDRAVLEIDGNRNMFIEGQSYNVGGNTIEFEYMTDLPPGDIPVVHRVVEKNNNSLETMGDANSNQIEFERDVQPSQIHGKMFFNVPRLGLVKILSMDFLGLSGEPFRLDATPSCTS